LKGSALNSKIEEIRANPYYRTLSVK